MPIQTKIKFKDFLKGVMALVEMQGKYCEIINGKGSARRIELFNKASDNTPCDMRVVHEAKMIYSDDLKKICQMLKITKKEFQDTIDSL